MSPVAFITGGAKRIGAALAADLAAAGFDIGLHYNTSRDGAEEAARQARAQGVQCELFQADLADGGAAEGLMPQVTARFGRLDVLINNASLFIYDQMASFDRAAWDRHLAVNFTAPVLLLRAYHAHLAATGAEGLAINLLDQKVGNPNPDYFSYTAGKVALAAMTQTLAMASAPHLRVCGVAPGVTLPSGEQTQDDFQRAAAATPLGRSSDLADVLRTVRYVIETPSLTGQIITVDGGESLLRRTRDVAYDV